VLVSVLVSVMCCSSVIVCIHPERLNNVRMYNVHPKLNRLWECCSQKIHTI